MAGLITVKASQLTGAAANLRSVGRSLQAEIPRVASKVEPQFRSLVLSKASTPYERRLIAARVRVAVKGNGVRLEATGGRLRNGLSTAEHGGAVEFGTNRGKTTTYRRSGKRAGTVRRHTARQMRQFNKAGYVFTPAVKSFVPQFKRALVETAVEVIEDALTGKG